MLIARRRERRFQVRGVIDRLGYPRYIVVILSVWKFAGAIALAIRWFHWRKEWAYAGRVFEFPDLLYCAAEFNRR